MAKMTTSTSPSLQQTPVTPVPRWDVAKGHPGAVPIPGRRRMVRLMLTAMHPAFPDQVPGIAVTLSFPALR